MREAAILASGNQDLIDILMLVKGQDKGKVKKRSDGTTNQPTYNQVRLCDVSNKTCIKCRTLSK